MHEVQTKAVQKKRKIVVVVVGGSTTIRYKSLTWTRKLGVISLI